jgi:type I restriction enzyme S subunit
VSENWITTNLGEYISFKNGKSSPSRDMGDDIPVYGSNGIIGFSSENNADENSLIVGRVGSYCGSVYHSKIKCWVTDNAIIGIPKLKGESEFWYFLLTKLQLNSYRSGSGQPLLNQSTLNSISISIPEHHSVRRMIGKQLFSFENKIHLNNQINQTLESIAQALFKSWFIDFEPVRAKIAAKQEGKDPERAAMCAISGKSEDELDQLTKEDFAELQATAALFPDELVESELGEVPRGWEVSTIGEQTQTVGGATPSTKNDEFWDNGNNHWTTPKDLSNLTNKILLNTDRKITDAGLKKINSGLLPKDTVLMSSRAPVGYLALAKIKVAINQGYIAILPNTKYSAEYLIQWCEANMAEIKGRASGTTFLEISKKNFREINFICSDEKVVTVYTKTVKMLYDEISLKAEENQSLINLRDTLLPKLLSGELEVLT